MIRPLSPADCDVAAELVDGSWRTLYRGIVAEALLSPAGCRARRAALLADFHEKRLEEYVYEENGQVLGLLSVGKTADADRPGAFEVWRVYLTPPARGRGLGGRLLAFAEERAKALGFGEIVIWAFRENRRAVRFYQNRGYSPDKTAFLGPPYEAWGVRLLKKIKTT